MSHTFITEAMIAAEATRIAGESVHVRMWPYSIFGPDYYELMFRTEKVTGRGPMKEADLSLTLDDFRERYILALLHVMKLYHPE